MLSGDYWSFCTDSLTLTEPVNAANADVVKQASVGGPERLTFVERQRLRAWIEDLKQKLRHRLEARRIKQEITLRAREIWEQNGRPSGRDLEFWLQAESEIRERSTVTALPEMLEGLDLAI